MTLSPPGCWGLPRLYLWTHHPSTSWTPPLSSHTGLLNSVGPKLLLICSPELWPQHPHSRPSRTPGHYPRCLPRRLPKPWQSQSDNNFVSEIFLGFLFPIPTGLGQAPFLNLLYLAPTCKLAFCVGPHSPGYFLPGSQCDLSTLQIRPCSFSLKTFPWLPLPSKSS